jgi:hypothetical protein
MSMATQSAPRALELTVIPFVNEAHPTITVELFVDGRFASRRVFQHERAAMPLITEPAERWIVPLADPTVPTSNLWLVFRISRPCAPSAIGLGNDSRRLGIGLVSMAMSV